MRKFFIINTLLLLFSFNVKAIEFKPYISSKINSNFVNYDIKEGEDFKKTIFGGSVAVGFFNLDNSLPLRAEFEFSVLPKVEKTTSIIISNLNTRIKLNTYYLNLYYDFYNLGDIIILYLNSGFGLAKVDIKMETLKVALDKRKISFSWQVGLGSYYKINDNLFADLGLKYNQTSFSNIDLDTDIIILSLGLKYNF